MRVSVYGSIGLLTACLAGGGAAWGQAPRISLGGIVNAASFGRGGSPSPLGIAPRRRIVAQGSIVSIFGEHLAAETAVARETPLPGDLAGTRVLIDGIEAPLFFVSPRQINLQVPFGLPSRPDRFDFPAVVDVEVVSAEGSSVPVSSVVGMSAPGIFTWDASGCGEATVLNIDDISRWALSLHSKENSLSPGGHFLVFGTGIGPVHCDSPAGHPNTYGPGCTPRTPLPKSSFLGPAEGDARVYAKVHYAGRAPGFVGLDQWNLQVPEDAPEGCSIPLQIEAGGGLTQTIPLHIRQGGGRCEEKQAVDRLGELIWERRTLSKESGTEESFHLRGRLEHGIEGVTIDFSELPSLPYPVSDQQLECAESLTNINRITVPRKCPPFVRVPLDGGVVTALLPDGTRAAAPSLADTTDSWFRIPFETDQFRPGEVRTMSLGGLDVGPFQTSVHLPAPIVIENEFPPGSEISADHPLVVR